MSAEQWLDLVTYYQLEPFGYEIENLRPAIIASTIANVNATRGKVFSPHDFVPKFGERKPNTAELHARILAALPVGE